MPNLFPDDEPATTRDGSPCLLLTTPIYPSASPASRFIIDQPHFCAFLLTCSQMFPEFPQMAHFFPRLHRCVPLVLVTYGYGSLHYGVT